MAKTYIELDRPIKEYTAENLRQVTSGLNNAELLRTIILNEKKFIRVNYDRSLRGFWYSTVKPTLDKLNLLTEKDSSEEGLTKWDKSLSYYVAELVRMGAVTYKDLHIVDTSRQRSTPADRYASVNNSIYGYQITAAPYANIIISTEKDTVYSIIDDIATFFGCSCISGKGQNSLAAMEDLLLNMNKAIDNEYEPIYILTMTDYDPAGHFIAQTFYNQVEDLHKSQGITRPVYIERIGITPNQLTRDEVLANWYTPKNAGLDKWMEETGGIYGQAKGLELDALEPDKIRRIFIQCLRRFIDDTKYTAFIKRAYIQNMALEIMQGKVDLILKDVIKMSLDSVELKDIDLYELAASGYRHMPVEQLCHTGKTDAIQTMVLSRFA